MYSAAACYSEMGYYQRLFWES